MIMQHSERLASLRAESMLSIEPFFPKANFFLKCRKETVRPLSGGPQSGTFLSDAPRQRSGREKDDRNINHGGDR